MRGEIYGSLEIEIMLELSRAPKSPFDAELENGRVPANTSFAGNNYRLRNR